MRRALAHPSFMIGAILSALILTVALVSLVWTPYDPGQMRIMARLNALVVAALALAFAANIAALKGVG